MSRLLWFSGLVLLIWNGSVWADDILLPAGTLLRCTLDEPSFSSKTAEEGDPVLCKTNGLTHFGRPVSVRGAYIGARLEEYKDPGHFWGKGYLRLEFSNLGLPHTDVPISAKVIAVRGYKVNREGNIMGRGHAKRDVAQWMFPPLWPWKVISLPARGPRPVLKGEVPVTLRLMDTIAIPQAGDPALRSFGRLPESRPSGSTSTYVPSSATVAERQRTIAYATPVSTTESVPIARQPAPKLTLFLRRDGTIFDAKDYWIDDGYLAYVSSDTTQKEIDLGEINWAKTNQINSDRGVRVILRTRNEQTY